MKIKLFVCLWLLTCGTLLQAMSHFSQPQGPYGGSFGAQRQHAFGVQRQSAFGGYGGYSGQNMGPRQPIFGSLNTGQSTYGPGSRHRGLYGGHSGLNMNQSEHVFGGYQNPHYNFSDKQLAPKVEKVIELLNGLKEKVEYLKEGQAKIIKKLDELPELIISEVVSNINYFKKIPKGRSN